MSEVATREEDVLLSRLVRAREERLATVTSSPTSKVPYTLCNNSHDFVELMGCQVWNDNRCVKAGVVVSGEATGVVSNLLRQRLTIVVDIEGVLYLQQYFRHALICDLDPCYRGWFDAVQRRRDRGRLGGLGNGREKTHGKAVWNILNGLMALTGSC